MINDDKTWFSNGVQENLDSLYGVALRLTRSKADAEDLVADTVTQAWSAFGTLKARDRFRPWLFRILHNRFVSEYRKQSARPPETRYEECFGDEDSDDVSSFLAEQPDEFLGWWAGPEKDCFRHMLGEEIMSAISALPEEFRMTVLLINVEGRAYVSEAALNGGMKGARIRREDLDIIKRDLLEKMAAS